MIITCLPESPGVLSVDNGNVSSLLYSDSDSIAPILSDRFHYEKPEFWGNVFLPGREGIGALCEGGRLRLLSPRADEAASQAIEAILVQCESDLRQTDFPGWPYPKFVQIYDCCIMRNSVLLGVSVGDSNVRWARAYQYRGGVVRQLNDNRFTNTTSSVSFEDCVVIRTFDDEAFFLGLDSDLNELWSLPCPSIGRLCAIGDKVALYIEKKEGLKRTADVVVVNPRTGKEIWRHDFPSNFRNLWSHDGLLYIACHGSGCVFDGETGEQRLVLKDVCDAQVHREMLFGNGDYVFFVNYSYTLAREAISERIITVFNQKTGEKIAEIEIPEGWEFREFSRVVHRDRKFYVPIQSNYSLGSAGGILVIDCDDLNSEIRFDSDITFDTRMVSVGKEVECEVHVSWGDFDEIMRYAPPAMKAVGVSEGRSVLCGKEVKNKKFNGKVHLVIDASAVELGDWEREQLDMAVSCVTDRFSGLGFYASDGKTEMTAHWRVA